MVEEEGERGECALRRQGGEGAMGLLFREGMREQETIRATRTSVPLLSDNRDHLPARNGDRTLGAAPSSATRTLTCWPCKTASHIHTYCSWSLINAPPCLRGRFMYNPPQRKDRCRREHNYLISMRDPNANQSFLPISGFSHLEQQSPHSYRLTASPPTRALSASFLVKGNTRCGRMRSHAPQRGTPRAELVAQSPAPRVLPLANSHLSVHVSIGIKCAQLPACTDKLTAKAAPGRATAAIRSEFERGCRNSRNTRISGDFKC
ncbi:hypothetical protein C8Q79DRAFT_486468 [Trametes meyenii]|nr:hypothetical protein C8Q79DRAFT_486468 [Trametes meyenii]